MGKSSFSLQGFTNCVEIDRGGSAVIFRADQPEFGRRVAIKVLSSFRDPAAVERFNTERKTMGQLSHAQGIVSVYASGTTDQGDPYLVLPFYENGSLQDELDNYGPLRWRKAAQHVIEVCRSVDFAHSKGVHHRDIKPANLLVADDGNVHIADFGIASLALADPGKQMLCTPAYAPPEVLWGDTTASPVSIDVYGLGASLWALLDGRAPFSGIYASEQGEVEHHTMRSWATTHQLEDFAELVYTEPVADLRETVPDPICATVEQAMSKVPEERFSSARALGNALRYSIRLSAEELVQREPARLANNVGQRTLVANGAPSGAVAVDKPDIDVMEPTEQIPATPHRQEAATTVFQEADTRTTNSKVPPPPPPGSELPDDAKQNRVGASLLILAAIVAVVVVAGVGFLLATNADGSARGGTIGNYVDGQIEEANKDAELAGWDITEVPVRKDGTVAGQVVEQEIPPGTELDGGKTFKLHVSSGPELRQLPDFTGLTEQEARTAIQKANLKVGTVTEEVNEEVPFDEVSEVLVNGLPPADDDKYETNTEVDLVISAGPAEVTVLRVETAEEAEQILGEELRLEVELSEEFSDEVETGNVIRTDPAIGTKAKPGDTVIVYVSGGPRNRQIPNVIGLTADEAIDALNNEGFNVLREDRGPSNCRFRFTDEGRRQCDNYDNNRVWNYGPQGNADVGQVIRILVKD